MSRLLIKMRSKQSSAYEMEYNYHIQGLIYRLLRGSIYDGHDNQGYKFFCFSNIFPFNDLRKNDLRNLIVSSPNSEFISYLYQQLGYDNDIDIGNMRFKVDYCDRLNVTIPSHNQSFSLITGTPIITRIRKQKYEGIEQLKSYEYVYWRMDHPIDLFITQLEDNLIKKYNDYFGSNIERQPIFERCKFMKQVSTRLRMGANHCKQATLIGTTWEFFFEEANPLIQFALDAGLGELGSMGFGFMNLREGREYN